MSAIGDLADIQPIEGLSPFGQKRTTTCQRQRCTFSFARSEVSAADKTSNILDVALRGFPTNVRGRYWIGS